MIFFKSWSRVAHAGFELLIFPSAEIVEVGHHPWLLLKNSNVLSVRFSDWKRDPATESPGKEKDLAGSPFPFPHIWKITQQFFSSSVTSKIFVWIWITLPNQGKCKLDLKTQLVIKILHEFMKHLYSVSKFLISCEIETYGNLTFKIMLQSMSLHMSKT